MNSEQLRRELEPIVKRYHNDTETLHQFLIPIAKKHFDDAELRTEDEFQELSDTWNSVMVDIVEDNELHRRH